MTAERDKLLSRVDGLECMLDDEETAHADTYRLLEVTKARLLAVLPLAKREEEQYTICRGCQRCLFMPGVGSQASYVTQPHAAGCPVAAAEEACK